MPLLDRTWVAAIPAGKSLGQAEFGFLDSLKQKARWVGWKQVDSELMAMGTGETFLGHEHPRVKYRFLYTCA